MITHDWIDGLWAVVMVAGFSALYCPVLCWLLASRSSALNDRSLAVVD
ncbi:MAG: hypothetical protein SWY16_16635 [Cyanobacteriota bacterium]|nr:hypothetical protein [Cyanobacteriota bacterium]